MEKVVEKGGGGDGGGEGDGIDGLAGSSRRRGGLRVCVQGNSSGTSHRCLLFPPTKWTLQTLLVLFTNFCGSLAFTIHCAKVCGFDRGR